MTSVNVTTNKAQVSATTSGTQGVVNVGAGALGVVNVGTLGPQGPRFSSKELDESSVADNSIIYYDESAGKYKANTHWTVQTVTDGGNF